MKTQRHRAVLSRETPQWTVLSWETPCWAVLNWETPCSAVPAAVKNTIQYNNNYSEKYQWHQSRFTVSYHGKKQKNE